jgi:hypothetical protein
VGERYSGDSGVSRYFDELDFCCYSFFIVKLRFFVIFVGFGARLEVFKRMWEVEKECKT